MKKRLLTIILSGMIAASLVGCGEAEAPAQDAEAQATEQAPEETTEAEETEESEVGMANPWRDITEDEAVSLVPNMFKVPDGATNVSWSAMGEDVNALPGPMVQATFDLDDLSFTERAQVTGDNYEDISGLYYDWTVSDEVTMANWGGGNMTAKMYRCIGDSETVDLITWYDVEIGISYSLSTSAADLDGFDIQAIAEATYDESRQAYNSIPDYEEEDIPMDISGCDTFTQIVDKLQAGQGYANATIGDTDVLLVTSYTYDYDGDGEHIAAIDADIYMYDDDGSILYLGYVTSIGTAYPLAIDADNYLDIAGHHFVKKMNITDYDLLVVEDEAYEDFDTDGNATYYRTSDINTDFQQELEDDTLLSQYFDEYLEAEIIQFDTIQ